MPIISYSKCWLVVALSTFRTALHVPCCFGLKLRLITPCSLESTHTYRSQSMEKELLERSLAQDMVMWKALRSCERLMRGSGCVMGRLDGVFISS